MDRWPESWDCDVEKQWMNDHSHDFFSSLSTVKTLVCKHIVVVSSAFANRAGGPVRTCVGRV